jgi:hypothetical protein
MRAIILAAGESRRFKEEGYTTPKPFLNIELRGYTCPMWEHVFWTLPPKFWGGQTLYGVPPKWIGEMNNAIVMVHTKGPAHTALQVMNKISLDDTLILDADILNFTNDLLAITTIHCPAVLVSKSSNPAFSYVDALGFFNLIKEKERISQYAVRGAYWIPSKFIGEFMTIAETLVETMKEPYISHVFNQLTGEKIAKETTYQPIDWGTPLDVRLSGAHIVGGKDVCDNSD